MSETQALYRVARSSNLSVRVSNEDKQYIQQLRRTLASIPARPLSEADVVVLALDALRKSLTSPKPR